MPPAARIADPVTHPLPGMLGPGPGSLDVMIGYKPAWRGVPSAVASTLQSAKDASDAVIDAAEKATQAASGTPGYPAAKTAEETTKATAATTMGSMITGAAAGADIHMCAVPLPIPPHGPGVVIDGSETVLINNLPACRQGDTILEAVGPPDKIAVGEPTVMIDDSSGGGGGGGGGSGAGGAGGAGEGGTALAEPAYADTKPEPRKPGEPVQQVGKGTHWVELEMVDEADQPVTGERFLVVLPDRKEVGGSLDSKGQARLEGIKDPGSCRIKFPNLDADAWERWSPSPPPRKGAGAGTTAAPTGDEEVGPVPKGTDRPGRGTWRSVRQGECISSIAADTGHFWETIWNHPQNAELKRRRGDPNVLLPKDAVFVPVKRPKTESGPTDQHHKYRRRGEPSMLRLRFVKHGKPRANEPYELTVDGRTFTGTTDADGLLEITIPGHARRGTIRLGEKGREQAFRLQLGHRDPLHEITGIQQRLQSLGYPCGRVDGRIGPKTRSALERYQQDHQLEVTGEPDQPTRESLARDREH